MSKVLVPKYKVDRRLGVNLWGRTKSPYNTRPTRPGMHGKARRGRVSNYGLQLAQKQRMQFYYGMKEKQFRIFFTRSARNKGKNIADTLIGMLESRLDAFVYRMKWGVTIFASKQLIKHKHILVNGRVVSIASYVLSPGDVVSLRETIQNHVMIASSIAMPDREWPRYYEVEQDGKSAKFLKMPVLGEVPYAVTMSPQSIIEYYSRRM